MSLVLIIQQLDDQLFPDTGCVSMAAFAADHFGSDEL
jgi:hypothetical protein